MNEKQYVKRRLPTEDEFFPVLRISREDLQTAGFPIEGITDVQMITIADDMINEHLMAAYWLALEMAAEKSGLVKGGTDAQPNA